MSASRRDILGMLRAVWRKRRRIERRAWTWTPLTGTYAPADPADRAEDERLRQRQERLGELFGRVSRERAHIPYTANGIGFCIITSVDVDAGVITYTGVPA